MRKEYRFITLIIISIAPIAQLATDIYVPALPSMTHYFSTSPAVAQWTILAYLITFALGQPFLAPLADRFGRKPILIVGLLTFIVGSLMAACTDSIYLFYLARLIQGLGLTSTAVMMKVLAADCFQGLELVKVMTYAIVVYGFGPIIAPLLGAYLTHLWGWQSNFIVLAAFGGILLTMVVFLLRETKPEHTVVNLSTFLENVRMVLTDVNTVAAFICGGICFSVSYTFNMLAPFLIQNVLGYGIVSYGYISLCVGAAYLLGSISNRVFIKYFRVDSILRVGLFSNAVVAMVMFVALHYFFNNVYALILPSMVIVFISGAMLPNFIAKGISVIAPLKATAGALSGFVMMLVAALVVAINGFLGVTSLSTLSVIYIAISLIALLTHGLVILIARKKEKCHVR